jgi:hypothetical protein
MGTDPVNARRCQEGGDIDDRCVAGLEAWLGRGGYVALVATDMDTAPYGGSVGTLRRVAGMGHRIRRQRGGVRCAHDLARSQCRWRGDNQDGDERGDALAHRTKYIPRAAPYRAAVRSRSALAMTDTELKLIAAAAIMGDSSRPVNGYNTPAAMGTPAAL